MSEEDTTAFRDVVGEGEGGEEVVQGEASVEAPSPAGVAAELVSRGGVPDGHLIRLRALKGQVLVDELSGDEKVLIFPQGAVAGLAQLIRVLSQ